MSTPLTPDAKGHTEPLLVARDMSIVFQAGERTVPVVNNLDLTIGRGEAVGLVGESGSGKSMTSLAIMGLVPPTGRVTGSITFHGQELLGMPQRQLRSLRGDRIAMIFQDPISSLNPYYTVGLQLAEAYRAHRGGTRKAAKQIAVDAMNRVRIRDAEHRVDHYPHQFSGGMRQRIMIAMALICEPDLIIADEPTTALDVTVQAQVLELISQLRAETGASMLFITHDLAVVSQVVDRVVVMRHGNVMEAGTTKEIFSDPRSDYTRALLDATPRLEDPIVPSAGSSASRAAATSESR